jgi:hypothetical protein
MNGEIVTARSVRKTGTAYSFPLEAKINDRESERRSRVRLVFPDNRNEYARESNSAWTGQRTDCRYPQYIIVIEDRRWAGQS